MQEIQKLAKGESTQSLDQGTENNLMVQTEGTVERGIIGEEQYMEQFRHHELTEQQSMLQ